MFCPNCGAQNQDTATACTKCGFALKAAAAAPKFKGTMLMMNAPQAGAPRPSPQPAGAPPPAAPVAAQPPAPAPAAPVAPAAAGPKPKLKGTMIGVAPPSLGSNVAAPAPVQPVAQPPAPAYAPPPAFEPPPPAAPAPAPSMAAPVSSVNPLGGTMVADTSGFGFPQAQPPAPGGHDIGGPPPGFGGPPPGFGGPPQGFGGADALGQTAPAADAQQPMGMAPAYQPPPTAAMAPVAQAPVANYEEEDMPIPGVQGGPNPIVTVLLIVLTFGLYGIYLLVKGKKSN